jgi:hyperosmotically inducible periplasmic protein
MKTNTFWALLPAFILVAGCQEKIDNTATTPPAPDQTNRMERAARDSQSAPSRTDSDNTAKNVRDRDDATLTPGDQGQTAEDIKITQQIRKALVIDAGDYSISAKNIKIITENGKVTLRGPVNSQAEKAAIATMASAVVGEVNVDNQLEVKTQPQP